MRLLSNGLKGLCALGLGIIRLDTMKVAWLLCLLVVSLALLGSGCASSSSNSATEPKPAKLDPRTAPWNDYVGTYTYDQAVQDLGKPAVVGEDASGRTAEWVLRHSPRMSFGFGVGGGSVGPHTGVGVGAGSSISPPPHGENLRLKFDTDGKLKEWTKVTY